MLRGLNYKHDIRSAIPGDQFIHLTRLLFFHPVGLISYFGVSAAQEYAYSNDRNDGSLYLSVNSGVDLG